MLLPKPAFAWDFRTSSLVATRGSGTFTVARSTTPATRINALGEYENVAANLPRFSLQPDGVMRLMVEGPSSHVNDCLQSENFGATWVAVGTPTRSAAAKTCGTLVLDLIGDDAAGTLEGYTQNTGATSGGNTIKPFSFHIAQGTSVKTVARVLDTTAVQDRVLLAVEWDAGGKPVVTMTTGTTLTQNGVGYRGPLANGVYRIICNSTTVTAANTHSVEIYPATDAALSVGATGNAYIGGVDWGGDNGTHVVPSYTPTTVATASRNADDVVLTGFTMPAAGTIVCRARTHSLVPASDGTARRLFTISDGTTNELFRMVRNASSANANSAITDGGVAQAGDLVGAAVTENQTIAIALAYSTNNCAQSINGGAVSTDLVCTMPTVDRITLGATESASSYWNSGIESLMIYSSRLPDSMLPQLCFASV